MKQNCKTKRKANPADLKTEDRISALKDEMELKEKPKNY
jgi:hypothetical protein